MWTCFYLMVALLGRNDGKEPTDRLVPPGWTGNPWGPAATDARRTGALPAIAMDPNMARWEAWGKATLRDGDVVFRRANARVLFGYFPFSKFIANASGSPYSHTGIVAIEAGLPVVYDSTKAGVRRQPFAVWVLDNVGGLGVKRPRTARAVAAAAGAVQYCRDVFRRQVPFDYDLEIDDRALYCVEMTEKAYRSAGVPLSEPVLIGDMERASEFPVCIFVFLQMSNLKLDQPVFFPGNERHGIWSSPDLATVYGTGEIARATSPSTGGAVR